MTLKTYDITGIPIGPPPDRSYVMDDATLNAIRLNGPDGTVQLDLPVPLETALLNSDCLDVIA